MTAVEGLLLPACALLGAAVPDTCTLIGRFPAAVAALITTGLVLACALLGVKVFLGRRVVEEELYVNEVDNEVDEEPEEDPEEEPEDELEEDVELVLVATRVPFLIGLPEPLPLLLLVLLLLISLEMGVEFSATSLPEGLTTRPVEELSEDSVEVGSPKFQMPVP